MVIKEKQQKRDVKRNGWCKHKTLCQRGTSSFFHRVVCVSIPRPTCLSLCRRSSRPLPEWHIKYKLPLCVFTWSRIHIQSKPQVQNANYSDRNNERRSQRNVPHRSTNIKQSEEMSSNLILNARRNTLRATVNKHFARHKEGRSGKSHWILFSNVGY